MKDYIYQIKNIHFSYDTGFTLDIPGLNIERAASIGLSGFNGSGKSTLMKILALVQKPDRGELFINENLVSNEMRVKYYPCSKSRSLSLSSR